MTTSGNAVYWRKFFKCISLHTRNLSPIGFWEINFMCANSINVIECSLSSFFGCGSGQNITSDESVQQASSGQEILFCTEQQ